MAGNVVSFEVYRPVLNVDETHMHALQDALVQEVGPEVAASFHPSSFDDGAKVFYATGGMTAHLLRTLGMPLKEEDFYDLAVHLDDYDFPPPMDNPMKVNAFPVKPYPANGKKGERLILTIGQGDPILSEQGFMLKGVREYFKGMISRKRMEAVWRKEYERFARLDIGSIRPPHMNTAAKGLAKVLRSSDIIAESLQYGPFEIADKVVKP